MKEIIIGRHKNSEENEILSTSFENEVNLLLNIDHPNIIDYYGFSNKNNHLQIYIEYLSGGSIISILKEYGKMSKT